MNDDIGTEFPSPIGVLLISTEILHIDDRQFKNSFRPLSGFFLFLHGEAICDSKMKQKVSVPYRGSSYFYCI